MLFTDHWCLFNAEMLHVLHMCMYMCALCIPVQGVCDYTWCLGLAPHLYMVSVISTPLMHGVCD